jgi:hypothetical protein
MKQLIQILFLLFMSDIGTSTAQQSVPFEGAFGTADGFLQGSYDAIQIKIDGITYYCSDVSIILSPNNIGGLGYPSLFIRPLNDDDPVIECSRKLFMFDPSRYGFAE